MRQRLWICRFAWTTQTRCPHTHIRRKSSSRKLLDLKDKGRRDYTLTSAIPGPSSGVHFSHAFGIVLLAPFVRGDRICKNLDVIGVAGKVLSIDVNPNGLHWSLLGF